MKKTLAVLLSVILTLAVIPVAFAANDWTTTNSLSASQTLPTGTTTVGTTSNKITVTIPAGVVITIPNGGTLQIANGSDLVVSGTLNINAGGKLAVLGGVTISKNGTVSDYGTVTGHTYITNLNGGTFIHHITINPYSDSSNYMTVGYATSDVISPDSITYTTVDPSAGVDVPVKDNQYLFINAHLADTTFPSYTAEVYGTDAFDDALENVEFQGTQTSYSATYANGSHYILVTTAGEITCDPVTAANFQTKLTQYTVILPQNTGYSVYTKSGETGTIKATCGQNLEFKVELAEGYTQSDYAVYAYDSIKWTNATTEEITSTIPELKANSNGYYTIPHVASNYKIIVVGVVSDKMINTFSNIMDFIQRIFETFKDVFATFKSLLQELGLFGGTSSTTTTTTTTAAVGG